MPAPLVILEWILGGRTFGTDVASVVHIEPSLLTRPIPNPAQGVESLCVHQGVILPVLHLPTILSDEPDHQWPDGSVHLVMQASDTRFVLRVDRVLRIFRTDTDALELLPHDEADLAARLCRSAINAGDTHMWLVDLRRMLKSVGLTKSREFHAPTGG